MSDDLLLSTDLIEPKLRCEYWRALTRPLYRTERFSDQDESGLAGSLRSRFYMTLGIGHSWFNSQRYYRDRRVVRESNLDDFYLIQLRQSGAADVNFERHAVSIRTGDITAFDLAQTWSSRSSDGATFSIVLPREPIDRSAGGRSIHGTILKAGSPIAVLLSDFLVGLSELPASLDREDVLSVEQTTTAMLVSALARRSASQISDEPAVNQVWRRQIVAFVDANLRSQDLGPDLLLSKFRISRAHLYRMFAAEGGVAAMVRNRRLDVAYRELVGLAAEKRSITMVANDLAFSSSSQFLRAFRARFGMTPSDAKNSNNVRSASDGRLSQLENALRRFARDQSGKGT